MKVRSVAIAIAALALWLIPSGALAQGKSGKGRLTICHIPPGNPDARRTMTLPEAAWGAHESHGDTLGPCNGYGVEEKRAKKAGKKKSRKRESAGPEGGSGGEEGEEIDSGEETGDGTDIGEGDSGADGDGVEDTVRRSDRRTERKQRRAERRENKTPSDAQTGDTAKAQSDGGDPEEQGITRRMRRFFGFGGNDSDD
jgi:hypothetical protein